MMKNKLTLEKFTVVKLKNLEMIKGGQSRNGLIGNGETDPGVRCVEKSSRIVVVNEK